METMRWWHFRAHWAPWPTTIVLFIDCVLAGAAGADGAQPNLARHGVGRARGRRGPERQILYST
eukprot:4443346-Pyramimonas_sp.AAC.1